MPTKSIIVLFDKFTDARAAEEALVKAGIPGAWMGLLVNNTGGNHPRPFTNPVHALPQEETISEATTEVGVATAAGLGVGGMIGGALEVATFMLPGIGAVAVTGLLAVTLAGLGGTLGGLIAALSAEDGQPDDTEVYEEAVRRGATLLLIRCEARDVGIICKIANANGAYDVEERSRTWRADGWVGIEDGAAFEQAQTPNAPAVPVSSSSQ